MVILGGLEILAAGYVLNEINKDDKRAKSEERRRRKKHRHDDSHSRPSRPQVPGLMPPQNGPGRPNSAPPPMSRPPYQHPPMPQVPVGGMGGRPPQTQTWPAQARPPTQAEAAQYLSTSSQPNLANPATYPGPPPPRQSTGMPIGPGRIQHASTMYFDTKTGKWQGNMLPAEMQPQNQSGNGRRSFSNVKGREGEGQRSSIVPLQGQGQMQMVRRREGSFGSVSSTSGNSGDEDLAYGKAYGRRERKPMRVMSHERERSHELSGSNVSKPMVMELDWYATQKKPAMAQVMMNRENRAATLPTQYSQSQPNFPVFEMDGTGVMRQGRSPRLQPQPMELDSRDTERYRAYRPV